MRSEVLIVTLLYLANVSTSASNNNIVSVVKDVTGRWKVSPEIIGNILLDYHNFSFDP